jgi:hypothetical protein
MGILYGKKIEGKFGVGLLIGGSLAKSLFALNPSRPHPQPLSCKERGARRGEPQAG